MMPSVCMYTDLCTRVGHVWVQDSKQIVSIEEDISVNDKGCNNVLTESVYACTDVANIVCNQNVAFNTKFPNAHSNQSSIYCIS